MRTRKIRMCVCCTHVIFNRNKHAKYCIPCALFIADYVNQLVRRALENEQKKHATKD